MALPARDPGKAMTPRGKRLQEQMRQDPELLRRTEQGLREIEQGKFVTWDELKKELGDV